MESAQRPARRLELDRLRIAACLSTFCYHTVQVFDLNPFYHVKSHTLSPGLDVAARLLHAVRMPLFFMIAGIVGFLALGRYANRDFMHQRATRLLPAFFFGIIFLTPAVKYIEMLDGRNISWRGIIETGITVPDLGTFLRRYYTQQRWFSWSHMWFPLYLFLLSWLLLPAMRWIAAPARDKAPDLPLALVLPLALLISIEVLLRPIFPNHVPNLIWDWASMSVYVVVMLAGAGLARWPDIGQGLSRVIPVMALVTAVGIALYLAVPDWPFKGIGRALTLWGTLAVLFGLTPWISGGRIPAEGYFADAVFPLYVLHHVPLLVIACNVKDLPWPIWQRYLVILLGAFVVTLAAYHLLVRPFGPMRSLFGLSAARRPAS